MALILNRNDVSAVLKMKECMDVTESAFKELADGTAILPFRTTMPLQEGMALYMPAYLEKQGAWVCKVVSVFKNNTSQYNLPVTLGKVLLQDPRSGQVVCIMDGAYLTAVRTGAASGVATRYLARKEKGQTVGLLGAGVQARMQLWAMTEARSISEVIVYDPATTAVQKFIAEMQAQHNLEIFPANSVDEVLNTDIICTATSATTPLFDGAMVKEGTHINAIGTHTPPTRELDSAIVKRSKFVCDSREACFRETGDFLIPLQEGTISENHFYAELSEIISGSKPGRISEREITLFKSNGLAIQDAATAKLVYDKAVAAPPH